MDIAANSSRFSTYNAPQIAAWLHHLVEKQSSRRDSPAYYVDLLRVLRENVLGLLQNSKVRAVPPWPQDVLHYLQSQSVSSSVHVRNKRD